MQIAPRRKHPKTPGEIARRKRSRVRNKRLRKVRRARLMQVVTMAENVYQVIGERRHIVAFMPDGIVDCDCGNASHECSHVIAVRMSRGEFKEEPAQIKTPPNPNKKPRSAKKKFFMKRGRRP